MRCWGDMPHPYRFRLYVLVRYTQYGHEKSLCRYEERYEATYNKPLNERAASKNSKLYLINLTAIHPLFIMRLHL